MGKDQKLTVYNVNTGENWRTVTIGSSTRYIFSPDDKYILLGTEYWDIVSIPHYIIYALDYKTGKKKDYLAVREMFPALIGNRRI